LTRNCELQLRRHDGTNVPVLCNASAYRDENGNVLGVLVVTRDITGQKQVEEERQRLENRLRQAQKMEAIGALAGGIAHDFNNILGAVSGFTELAMERVPEDGKVRNYLKQIFGATRRATDLVAQILEFSRQKENDLCPIKMIPAIKEATELLRATIPSNIEIRLELDADPDMIMGDIFQIQQLFMNLCTNAYHAMREGGGILEISLAKADINPKDIEHPGLKASRYLNLSVCDTGHGISPEHLDRIFDPFFTTKKPGEGTGLGLSVVHGIVKNHHGIISVSSRVGEGSVFNIWLPMIEEEQIPETTEPEIAAIKGEGRILVVDDEPLLSEMLRDMLEGLGYKVTAMISSMEALWTFSAHPERFDLVITDQTMPDMTGLAFAEEILKIKPEIPIILCTGFSHTIDPEQAKAAGIKEFVMKPIVKRKIAATIERLLKGGHSVPGQ
ncbi:MAG: response regulator, partial [Syntrophales bacterium]|nr:response regulator [Syntrophales bacterium]